jgi:hypothetical protein
MGATVVHRFGIEQHRQHAAVEEYANRGLGVFEMIGALELAKADLIALASSNAEEGEEGEVDAE